MTSRGAHSMQWLTVLVLCLLSGTLHAEKLETLPAPTDYVSDYAHVLSPQTVQTLDQLCGQLDHSATNAQIAIVTINTLDGDDVADYANRLEERWKVGKKGSDRGILMLFAVQDRKRWIEVGYGLEGILPDGKVGQIGRAMVPFLRQKNYDAAITLGTQQIASVISADAKVTLQDQPQQAAPVQQYPPRYARPAPIKLTLGHIILLVLAGIFALYMIIRHPWIFFLLMNMSGGGGGEWRGGNGGRDRDNDGFGGFGGGQSGGGGAGGDW